MNEWAAEELRLLRHCWPTLIHAVGTPWCMIPGYIVPAGWSRPTADVAFQMPEALPGQEPYGFWIRDGIALANGVQPTNYTYPVATTPWGGAWGQFSWNLSPWVPGARPGEGTGMVAFVRSFTSRLQELN